MIGFLDGLRVLDFSHMLAGPMAARRLADFGAHVVKVEPKGGEGLRTRGRPIDIVDGDHLRFHAYNAGKQSIELEEAIADLERTCEIVDGMLRERQVPRPLAANDQ